MWEKRYNLLHPGRTEDNKRYYCQSDVKLLTNLAFLVHNGYKIGKLTPLSEAELSQLVDKIIREKPPEDGIDHITQAIILFDTPFIEEYILGSFQRDGMYETFIKTILPLSAKLNLLALMGKITQSQIGYFLNLIQKIFIVESSKYPHNKNCRALHLVLYPLASKRQYISTAAINCGLRANQIRCTELGKDCPVDDLSVVYTILKPDGFVTPVPEDTPLPKFYNTLMNMVKQIGNSNLYIISAGNVEDVPSFPRNVRIFPDVITFMKYTDKLKTLKSTENR